MKIGPHWKHSLVNAGAVTVFTSLAMTAINNTLTFGNWLPNWLISWFIVFNYVYWFAPKVNKFIHKRW